MKRFLKNFYGKIILSKKKIEPCIIIMVDGGLGSQLNKYIIGQVIKYKTKAEVKYDLSWFERHGKSIDNKDNRNFELTKLFPETDFPVASKKEIEFYRKYFRYSNKKIFKYNKKILNFKPPVYIDGYISNSRYLTDFKDLGLNDLKFNMELTGTNKEIFDDIKLQNSSVAIHVRRGDYVNSVHDILTSEYFVNAINYLQKHLEQKNPKFYIFSNGMEWVKNEIIPKLKNNINICLIEGNDNDNGAIDFYLMYNCQHQIISNASFGLFAAFLNKNADKIVIMPQFWMKNRKNFEKMDTSSAKAHRFSGWIVMSNQGKIIND